MSATRFAAALLAPHALAAQARDINRDITGGRRQNLATVCRLYEEFLSNDRNDASGHELLRVAHCHAISDL